MAFRVIGPLNCQAGFVNQQIIAPGDVIGTFTVADAPAGAVFQVAVGNQPLVPMEKGDVLDRLTGDDGSYGIYINLPPTAGTVTFFGGITPA